MMEKYKFSEVQKHRDSITGWESEIVNKTKHGGLEISGNIEIKNRGMKSRLYSIDISILY